jgi:hypothetical protein
MTETEPTSLELAVAILKRFADGYAVGNEHLDPSDMPVVVVGSLLAAIGEELKRIADALERKQVQP